MKDRLTGNPIEKQYAINGVGGQAVSPGFKIGGKSGGFDAFFRAPRKIAYCGDGSTIMSSQEHESSGLAPQDFEFFVVPFSNLTDALAKSQGVPTDNPANSSMTGDNGLYPGGLNTGTYLGLLDRNPNFDTSFN